VPFERGLRAVNLQPTDIVPQVEWFWPMSREAYIRLTGIDPLEDMKAACLAVIEKLELDLSWGGLPQPPEQGYPPEREGVTSGGQVREWGLFGTCWKEEGAHLSSGRRARARDVIEYDPWSYEQRSMSELVRDFQAQHSKAQGEIGNRLLVAEAHYTTLFHWFLGLFGWRPTVMAASKYPREFKVQVDRFAELSRFYMEAWSRVSGLHVFISHDDICMSNGPIFSPKWYRDYIFPHYEEIWAPLKERGIPVIFCSDGDLTLIVDDLFAAGADGLIFEPYLDLSWLARRWGGKKILIGNVNTRILTGGTPADVVREVERCIKTCGQLPGYFLNASGQLPHNIPWENLKAYLDTCRRMRRRR